MELSSKISSLWIRLIPPPNGKSYSNVSGYSWSSMFHCRRRREFLLIIAYHYFYYLCGDQGECGSPRQYLSNCLSPMAPPPLIRIRNDYAWTPVFPKAKVKIQKGNKTKPKKIQWFLFLYLLYFYARVNPL